MLLPVFSVPIVKYNIISQIKILRKFKCASINCSDMIHRNYDNRRIAVKYRNNVFDMNRKEFGVQLCKEMETRVKENNSIRLRM